MAEEARQSIWHRRLLRGLRMEQERAELRSQLPCLMYRSVSQLIESLESGGSVRKLWMPVLGSQRQLRSRT